MGRVALECGASTSRPWDSARGLTVAMSALGQTRQSEGAPMTSGVPTTSDVAGPSRHFRKEQTSAVQPRLDTKRRRVRGLTDFLCRKPVIRRLNRISEALQVDLKGEVLPENLIIRLLP